MLSTTELFGGALTVQLPAIRVDISDIREIPDNQEVFAHTSTDQSIIIEVMEYQQAEDDDQALRTYFEDLAETHSAQVDVASLTYQAMDLSLLSAPQCKSCRIMRGIQSISKFKDTAANTVEIHMAVFRLPQFTSDILITFNNPLVISSESSSSGADPSTSDGAWSIDQFMQTVKSLTIVNEGLFG